MPLSPIIRKAIEEPLRIPQARLLRALMPVDDDSSPSEWPLITRSQLAIRSGYSVISGSVTRALNGIYETNTTSGDPHLGLIGKKMVEIIMVQIEEGLPKETNYRITPIGINAFKKFLASGRRLPKNRDASAHINDRYLKDEK